MARWDFQNMTYPLLLLPPHFSLSLATSPFRPSLSSGFFNTECICCRNSSQGHVNPPWHSWLSRQTDGQASGLTPLSNGPKGSKIYNWSNQPPMRLKLVWQIQRKLTFKVSYLRLKHLKSSSYYTFIWYATRQLKSFGIGLLQMSASF